MLDTAKQPLNITKLPQCSFLCMLHICVCARRADLTTSFVLPNSSLAFLWYAFNIGVLLGCLPLSPLKTKTARHGPIWQWCTLTFGFTSDLFGGCSGLFADRSYYPTLQFVINFPLAANPKEVDYSPMDLRFLSNMFSCCHRNIKLLRDRLIVFTFNMLE